MAMSINRTTAHSILLEPGEGRSIEAVGVQMTFKTVGSESDGQWLVLEYTAPPNFPGPPPHYHKVTTEIFYILEGTLTLRVGSDPLSVGAGGYAFVPPGTVHGFSNQTDEPAKFLLVASPAGLEDYFSELQQLISDEPQWPPKDMRKVGALMAKYDTFPPK